MEKRKFVWTDDLVKKFVRITIAENNSPIARTTMEEFKKEENLKPLFISEDKISVYQGDWCFKNFKDCMSTIMVTEDFIPAVNYKYFVLEDNAKKYQFMNKKSLSLQEVEDIIEQNSPSPIYYMNALMSKVRKND